MPDRSALPPPYVPAPLDFGDDQPRSAAPSRAASSQTPVKNGKLYRTGIRRDDDLMYFVKGGDVWAVPRKKPGKPAGKAVKLTSIGFEMDYAKFLYYVDGDGDIAVKSRG